LVFLRWAQFQKKKSSVLLNEHNTINPWQSVSTNDTWCSPLLIFITRRIEDTASLFVRLTNLRVFYELNQVVNEWKTNHFCNIVMTTWPYWGEDVSSWHIYNCNRSVITEKLSSSVLFYKMFSNWYKVLFLRNIFKIKKGQDQTHEKISMMKLYDNNQHQ